MNATHRRALAQFQRAVGSRLVKGAVEYGDRSLTTTPLPRLVHELMEETEDIAGWGFALWFRLKQLGTQIAQLERRAAWQREREQRNRALTRATRQLWAYLFPGETLPGEVRCFWMQRLPQHAAGEATIGGMSGDGEIRLEWPYLETLEHPLAVLLHELGHLRGYAHGREFTLQVRRWLRKLGIPEHIEAPF